MNAAEFLGRGGPVLWLIAFLSICTLALIFWKIWHLLRDGAWSGGRASGMAVAHWAQGDSAAALALLEGRHSLRARLTRVAMQVRLDGSFGPEAAREEVSRHARADLARARRGLRVLELVSSIAPLLGLLGTVLGMIEAFQGLQAEGAGADASTLAGGIWEALLTTAAGMAVAIPAGIALTWFESVIDTVQADMEDIATRVFTRGKP